MKKLFGLCFTTILVFCMHSSAFAVIVYDSFGPGQTYSFGPIYPVENYFTSSVGSNKQHADQFIPAVDVNLGQIDVAVQDAFQVNKVDLTIMTDSLGVPGSIVESFSLQDAMARSNTPNAFVTATSIVRPVLQAGVPYWLVVAAPENLVQIAYFMNDQDIFGQHAVRQNGGPWEVSREIQGVFRITGDAVNASAVPEPTTVLLFGTGMIGAALRRRKQA